MMINKYGYILEDQEIEDIVKRVTLLLKSKQFSSLVDGECYKEKAMRYKNNLRYIDLLVESGATYTIIDYKSSMAYASHHQKQVHYYKEAVSTITGAKVEGYLCYLLENEVKIINV